MIQDGADYNVFLARSKAVSGQHASNEHAGAQAAGIQAGGAQAAGIQAGGAPIGGAPVQARGSIDAPGRAVGNGEENIIWQTRDHAATDYENRLGDALEAAFESGADSPAEMAAHLNGQGVHAPDGSAWTADSFESVMRELGA